MDTLNITSLTSRLRTEVEKAGLTSLKKIILMTDEEFRELGNFNEEDIRVLKKVASRSHLPIGFIKASDVEKTFKKHWRSVILDCAPVDSLLRGGIPTRGITELSGKSGLGKSQLCLQYSLTVQYPADRGGLGLGAVYLCTESAFPAQRLHQLSAHFPRDSPGGRDLTTNVYIDHIATVKELKECLCRRLSVLLERCKIGLLVVDSIAALFRSDYTDEEYVSRARDLRDIGLRLHRLANRHGLAVICVNQVSDVPGVKNSIPALGLVWANLVTTKLQLTKNGEGQRLFQVLSAPHLPSGSCPYRILENGINCI